MNKDELLQAMGAIRAVLTSAMMTDKDKLRRIDEIIFSVRLGINGGNAE